MRLHTFTGFSNGGLDHAVADAHRNHDRWMSDNYYNVALKGEIKTTATIAPGDDDHRQEYWFTITIAYTEVQK